mmetsp:Transcript_23527/g.62049  ORF Transcript_23527/g.62049 Transcript_23527/m.62049 type:complete len:221 (-) Transcript_23527:360-1022(-)
MPPRLLVFPLLRRRRRLLGPGPLARRCPRPRRRIPPSARRALPSHLALILGRRRPLPLTVRGGRLQGRPSSSVVLASSLRSDEPGWCRHRWGRAGTAAAGAPASIAAAGPAAVRRDARGGAEAPPISELLRKVALQAAALTEALGRLDEGHQAVGVLAVHRRQHGVPQLQRLRLPQHPHGCVAPCRLQSAALRRRPRGGRRAQRSQVPVLCGLFQGSLSV